MILFQMACKSPYSFVVITFFPIQRKQLLRRMVTGRGKALVLMVLKGKKSSQP